MREDSLEELESLFDFKKRAQIRPLAERDLPRSFFKPPNRGTKTPTHSRQVSMCEPSSAQHTPANLMAKLASHLHASHARSCSEPAQMSGFGFGTGDKLPYGWQANKTANGQLYYYNYITNETSWQPPSGSAPVAGVGVEPLTNDDEALMNSIPLPNGWEKAHTAAGEVYFINHVERTTCWEDPRLPLLANLKRRQEVTPSSSSSSLSSASINFVSKEKHGLKVELMEIVKKKRELLAQLKEIEKQESFLKAQLAASMSSTASDSSSFDYLSSSSSSCTSPGSITYGQSQVNQMAGGAYPSSQQQYQQQPLPVISTLKQTHVGQMTTANDLVVIGNANNNGFATVNNDIDNGRFWLLV